MKFKEWGKRIRELTLFVPFRVLGITKAYFLWLFFIAIFGLFNIFAYILLGNMTGFQTEIRNGIIYSFSISICAPFFASFLVELIIDLRRRKRTKFLKFKYPVLIFDFIYIIILTIMWIGVYKSSQVAQVLIFLITLIASFYMYSLSEMGQDKNYSYFKEFDEEYLISENRSVENLIYDANNFDISEILNWRKK